MAEPKKYKPMRLRRWKLLKTAARHRNITLALRTVGLHKLPGVLRRTYTPQIERAKKLGLWPTTRQRRTRRRR